MTTAALDACAADVAALYSTYDPAYWWIDRMFGMEFLTDQFYSGQFSESFHQSTLRDHVRYGFCGYII